MEFIQILKCQEELIKKMLEPLSTNEMKTILELMKKNPKSIEYVIENKLNKVNKQSEQTYDDEDMQEIKDQICPQDSICQNESETCGFEIEDNEDETKWPQKNNHIQDTPSTILVRFKREKNPKREREEKEEIFSIPKTQKGNIKMITDATLKECVKILEKKTSQIAVNKEMLNFCDKHQDIFTFVDGEPKRIPNIESAIQHLKKNKSYSSYKLNRIGFTKKINTKMQKQIVQQILESIEQSSILADCRSKVRKPFLDELMNLSVDILQVKFAFSNRTLLPRLKSTKWLRKSVIAVLEKFTERTEKMAVMSLLRKAFQIENCQDIKNFLNENDKDKDLIMKELKKVRITKDDQEVVDSEFIVNSVKNHHHCKEIDETIKDFEKMNNQEIIRVIEAKGWTHTSLLNSCLNYQELRYKVDKCILLKGLRDFFTENRSQLPCMEKTELSDICNKQTFGQEKIGHITFNECCFCNMKHKLKQQNYYFSIGITEMVHAKIEQEKVDLSGSFITRYKKHFDDEAILNLFKKIADKIFKNK